MSFDDRRQLATFRHQQRRRRARMIAIAGLAIFAATVVISHLRAEDDWARFDHRNFPIASVAAGDSITIGIGGKNFETVWISGIVAPTDDTAAHQLLSAIANGHEATLLLATPQTRDERGRLIASVFVDGENLSVELAKAGLVFADRRLANIMSGLIDPAEAEARKKKRGIWQNLKFEQMPAWRQEWLRGFPARNAVGR